MAFSEEDKEFLSGIFVNQKKDITKIADERDKKIKKDVQEVVTKVTIKVDKLCDNFKAHKKEAFERVAQHDIQIALNEKSINGNKELVESKLEQGAIQLKEIKDVNKSLSNRIYWLIGLIIMALIMLAVALFGKIL